MKYYKIIKTLTAASLTALFLASCGSSGGGTGTLSVAMSDASTDQYEAIYVTIDSVQVNSSSDESTETGWQTIATPVSTFNLLELVNGTRETLGIADLDSGHYTQMRLILGDAADSSINILSEAHPFANYVIDLSGAYHELTVPSGMQTGIKIVQGFDINANSTTELILDFDASASVVVAGNSGRYMLKPTIKMLNMVDASIISGEVTLSSDSSMLANTKVSAQVFDNTAASAENRVVVETSTLSDADGNYSLFLSPGTYNLVFYKAGYAASVTRIVVAAGDIAVQNSALDATATGTLTLTSNISDADSEAYATESFRQAVTIDSDAAEIELFAINIADGGTSTVTLPASDIIVVSSSSGLTTQSTTVTIGTDTEATLDVSL